jgi:hypothetical protein|tara:strand:- start:361 stop:576 length:216 start_codon:yes stop_codon:yes gene_type:complete
MTIWHGRTPSFEEWKAEVEHEHRQLGDYEPVFKDRKEARERYQFLLRIGFFEEEKKDTSSTLEMIKLLFRV